MSTLQFHDKQYVEKVGDNQEDKTTVVWSCIVTVRNEGMW
jgi:hypothetical protein